MEYIVYNSLNCKFWFEKLANVPIEKQNSNVDD